MPGSTPQSILSSLLPHSTQAYAVRGTLEDSSTGKKNARYTTVRQPLPAQLFLSHFEGKQCISVCPLIGSGDMCQWGAIDIDSYGDEALLKQVRRATQLFQVPCFVEPSKSLGVHVYIILDRPIMAKVFRRMLKKLAVWLGHPKAEIRPAQDNINVAEGDVGTAMVLPAFGLGAKTAEKALQACVTSESVLMDLLGEGDFFDGPPCLFPLRRLNEQQGEWSQRNNYLYQLGVFLKYKYPSDWQDRMRTFNSEIIANPSPAEEVENLLKQLDKNGKCHYMCNREPFDQVCNKPECQSRRYGIGAREGTSDLLVPEGITKIATDPPTWFVTLRHPATGDTKRVKFTTNQLFNAAQFKRRVIEVLSIMPTMPSQKEWDAMLGNMMEGIETVPVPFEHTDEAKLLDDLYTFCTSAWTSPDIERLLQGRIHTQVDGDKVTFRFRQVDLVNYLSRVGKGTVDSQKILGQLQQLLWLGKIRLEQVSIPPVTLQVWTMETTSKYLALKAEMDAEKEEDEA
jgi:hypothetical protein